MEAVSQKHKIGWKFVFTVLVFHLMHGVLITGPFLIVYALVPLTPELKILLYVIQAILYVIVLPLIGYFILDFFYPAGKQKGFIQVGRE